MHGAERVASIEACEQRLVNLWPAADTLLLGGWVVRFANGYSGRANSASALSAGATLTDDDIALIVRLYRAAGLAPSIRLTPLANAAIEQRLVAAGWRRRVHSLGMLAETRSDWRADPSVARTASPPRTWLDGVCALQEPSKSNPRHLEAIVGRIRLPAAFATLIEDGAERAFGMACIDRGWAEIGSIIVADDARGRGLGRRLVASLLAWAGANGAERVFLQVEASNEAAIGLYRSLGFAELYAYSEYRLPD